jgi:hypothetical protein
VLPFFSTSDMLRYNSMQHPLTSDIPTLNPYFSPTAKSMS